MLTLLVYFLPVAALILGAFLGGACADALNMRYTPASIAGACLSMAVAFIVLKRFDKSRRAQKQFKPRMTRIVRRSSGCPSDNRQEESP